ncbi:MAG: hypothetical protein Hyperionvirus18_19 [Hyperionvirus sp.]|uniref:Uncharacterized protein n=1 Tax=Hyperionvirus sp. TaxID=2487770 RepID=A0A3G5AE40_9VIRU|nr:MAG: hypothetical protein Hyperionvirus18_19 [Hyperionvirus sp.]
MKLVKIIIDEYKEGNLITYDRSVIDFDKFTNYFMGTNNSDKLHLFQLIKDVLTSQAIQQRCHIKIYFKPDENDYDQMIQLLCSSLCGPVKWMSKKIKDFHYNDSLIGINYKYPNKSNDLLYNYYSLRRENESKLIVNEMIFDSQTIFYNDMHYPLKFLNGGIKIAKYKFLLQRSDYENEKNNIVRMLILSGVREEFRVKVGQYLGEGSAVELVPSEHFGRYMMELKDILISDMGRRGEVYDSFYKKYVDLVSFEIDDIEPLIEKSMEIKSNLVYSDLASSGAFWLYQINNLVDAIFNNIGLRLYGRNFEEWGYGEMIVVVLISFLFDDAGSLFILEPNELGGDDLEVIGKLRGEIVLRGKQVNVITYNNKINDRVRGKCGCVYVFRYGGIINVANIDISINKILSCWDIADIIENFNREHLICEGYSEYEYFSMCKFDLGYEKIREYELVNANGSSNSIKLLKIFSNILKDDIVGKTKIIILLDYDGLETIKQIFSLKNKNLFSDTRNINCYMWFAKGGDIVLERLDVVAKELLRINGINGGKRGGGKIYEKFSEIKNYGMPVELEDVFDSDPNIKKLNKVVFDREVPDYGYYKLNQRMKNTGYKAGLLKLGERRIPRKFFDLIDGALVAVMR